MSDWIPELQAALTREYDTRPNLATLATVDKTGAPRARTIVCRRIGPDGAIYLCSDGRSEKNQQIAGAPQSEIVFYLPTLREQFRLAGLAKLLGSDSADRARSEIWEGLSDSARAMFSWPTPGAKRLEPDDAFARALPATTPIPPKFEVIVLRPRRVEHLSLTTHPHRRRRWTLTGTWSPASELNP